LVYFLVPLGTYLRRKKTNYFLGVTGIYINGYTLIDKKINRGNKKC